MHELEADLGLGEFSGELPLFPLPDVVFYPCTLLPLHVFEPRYRRMVEDARKGEGLIGMVKLRPGWEGSYYQDPPVHDIACVGKLVEVFALPDGRYNVVLCGVKRARIASYVDKETPYRIARVELVDDRPIPESERARAEELKERLIRRIGELPRRTLKHNNLCLALKKLDAPLGCVADLVADSMLIAPPLKQRILDELCPIARARAVLDQIEGELSLLVGGGLVLKQRPPEPSLN